MHGLKQADTTSGTVANRPLNVERTMIGRALHAGRSIDERPLNELIDGDNGEVKPVKLWTSVDPCIFTPKEGKMTAGEALGLSAELAQEKDQSEDERSRIEVDKISLFATLFSAIVTAFIIEAHKLSQLDNLIRDNASATFPPLISDPELGCKAPSHAALVNGMWSLSLICSLGAALLGMMSQLRIGEWKKTSRSGASATEVLEDRCSQMDVLASMGVYSMVELLRAMLLLSVFFFAVGLGIFLLKVDRTMASIVTVTFGLMMVGAFSIGPLFTTVVMSSRSQELRESKNKATLGSLWVAREFPQDIRAIYAFVQSTEGIAPSLGKDLLRELYLFAWFRGRHLHLSAYLDMPRSKRCSEAPEHPSPRKPSELQEALLEHRFELFLRILNGASIYTPSDESPAHAITPAIGVGEAQIKNITSAFFSNDYDHIGNISLECRIQYCETVWMYMKTVTVGRVSLLLARQSALLKLLAPSLSTTSPWNMHPNVLQHVCLLNRRVAQYVVPNPLLGSQDPVKERVAKAILYVARILQLLLSEYKAVHPADPADKLAHKAIAEYTIAHPGYMVSIASLVSAIHETTSEASVGIPDDLLGYCERAWWRQLLDYYDARGRIAIPLTPISK
ncbi:hypothetical protein MD484_g5029, partial [Candolleomyces efflorescens]